MKMKTVRWLLLGILGGMGLIYLAAALIIGHQQATLSAAELAAVFDSSDDPAVLTVVFGALGAGMLLVGAGLFFGLGWSEKKRAELFQWGTIVNAVVEDVKENRAVAVNHRHPWQVYVSCRHPVTGDQVTLRSHSVFDLTVQKGDTVRVAFDPMDEKKYAVELGERSKK